MLNPFLSLKDSFKSSAFLCLLLLLQSCGEVEIPPGTYVGVNSDIATYFQRFEEEASARGIEINLLDSGVRATLTRFENPQLGGLCQFESEENPRHIFISEEFWEGADDFGKELIVFHELGHCVLFRKHLDKITGTFGLPRCTTIMHADIGVRAGFCRRRYTVLTRETFLDELFNPEFTFDIFEEEGE